MTTAARSIFAFLAAAAVMVVHAPTQADPVDHFQFQSATPGCESKEITAPAALYRAKMKIAGSTCIACLQDLQRVLLKVKGIADVNIQRPPAQILLGPDSVDLNDWADCTVTYDHSVLTLHELKAQFKLRGYHAYKITEKPLKPETAHP